MGQGSVVGDLITKINWLLSYWGSGCDIWILGEHTQPLTHESDRLPKQAAASINPREGRALDASLVLSRN